MSTNYLSRMEAVANATDVKGYVVSVTGHGESIKIFDQASWYHPVNDKSAAWYYLWCDKSYSKANMVVCIKVMGHWKVIPTVWPETKDWDSILKFVEVAPLGDPQNVESMQREDGARLNLAKYLADMPKLPWLEPFTTTYEAKVFIDSYESAGWASSSDAHLEGDLKIQGRILFTISDDTEIFENWGKFCVLYAKAHRELSSKM